MPAWQVRLKNHTSSSSSIIEYNIPISGWAFVIGNNGNREWCLKITTFFKRKRDKFHRYLFIIKTILLLVTMITANNLFFVNNYFVMLFKSTFRGNNVCKKSDSIFFQEIFQNLQFLRYFMCFSFPHSTTTCSSAYYERSRKWWANVMHTRRTQVHCKKSTLPCYEDSPLWHQPILGSHPHPHPPLTVCQSKRCIYWNKQRCKQSEGIKESEKSKISEGGKRVEESSRTIRLRN